MLEMTPEQAAFWLRLYLDTLKYESRITKNVIQAIPPDQCDYRPDPFAKSAMELARHIVIADNRFIETVTSGIFDTTSTIPDTVKTPAELAEWYVERHARNLTTLAAATHDQLVTVVDFRGIFKRPAYTFVMTGLHHTIHHRGQLSSYLRSMGGKVPAIYGESYDSAEAKRLTSA
jgi:uncharacterized damage-inducible protein DinB